MKLRVCAVRRKAGSIHIMAHVARRDMMTDNNFFKNILRQLLLVFYKLEHASQALRRAQPPFGRRTRLPSCPARASGQRGTGSGLAWLTRLNTRVKMRTSRVRNPVCLERNPNDAWIFRLLAMGNVALDAVLVNREDVMLKAQREWDGSQFDGDPEMPLLWYVRDIMQTGREQRFGCGIALCGACTVTRTAKQSFMH